MTDEPQPALSSFTVTVIPGDWPVDAKARTTILNDCVDSGAEQVDRGVRLTFSAPDRGDAMRLALDLWKEHFGPIEYDLGVQLELINGEPVPKTAPPIRFGPFPVLSGPDKGLIWLRFMPDVEAWPALWYLDPDDLDGVDHGLASDLSEVISLELRTDIRAWVEEWYEFHDCDHEEVLPPDLWVSWGERLLQQLRSELEPRGYRIQPRLH